MGDVNTVDISPNDESVWLLGRKGELAVSRDRGQTWDFLPLPSDTEGLDAIQFDPDGHHIWILGSRRNPDFMKSVMLLLDGAEPKWWSPAPGGVPKGIYFQPGGKKGWIIANWTHGPTLPMGAAIHKTLDGGQSWTDITNEVLVTLEQDRIGLSRIVFEESGQRGVIAGTGAPSSGNDVGLILNTQDFGETWREILYEGAIGIRDLTMPDSDGRLLGAASGPPIVSFPLYWE